MSDNKFKQVLPQINFPELENETIKYWKSNKIFEKSIESRQESKKWTFLDGPPFVTGMPHYGSLLSSISKDVFGRYWTMKGYRVRRVWGWDGHGLPIENKVENELEITQKKEIEEVVGVKKFIDECKHYVSVVSDDWEWYIDHIGRWVDFKNAYKTWDLNYMESVMWVFRQMYEKDYIYKGLRVLLYCPHCATPISNFEIAMDPEDNYKEIYDAAATYKYKLKVQKLKTTIDKNTYILAWSTTPWNKIVTPALAVNPNLNYVKIKQSDEYYILAKTTLKMLKNKSYKIVEEFKGSELVGLEFEPHYDYYKDKIQDGERAFEIIPGDFVTAEEGTGVVTIAAYGEEDMVVMRKYNVHIEMHLDDEGNIRRNVPKFGGMYYLKANKAVNQDLQKRGLIYQEYDYAHKVPLCWRCHTRLYYAPLNAWYVDVQKLKPLLKKTNENVNWFPKHFKYGRFLKSLENAPDWNISRNRYWGSPVPVWECECGERFVPGSIAELEKASGIKIKDLHKPEIDEVTVICKKCDKKAHRVSEVLDSWIEAGSASFAERHFPFNTKWKLKDFFPPDFIVEYTGQIRAWFYVLHVIGAALYESEAYKNVGVTGVILGTDGRKMSKNYKNYPDPAELLKKYGGDALRLYLMGSPVIHGEDIIISEDQYKNQIRGMMLVLWNTYNFFVTYANLDNWRRGKESDTRHSNVLDLWILSLLNQLISDVTNALDSYDTTLAIAHLQKFVDDLSTWYIRRSRDRVGPAAQNNDLKNGFYYTTWQVLIKLTQLLAPLAPFISEEIYKNLTNAQSVHLADWPEAGKVSNNLIEQMKYAREVASSLNEFRKSASVRVKIPFKSLSYKGPAELDEEFLQIVKDEANVQELKYSGKKNTVEIIGLANEDNQDIAAGKCRDIVRKIQAERKKLQTTFDEKVDVELPDWPDKFTEEIKRQALVRNLKRGQELKVVRTRD